MNSRRPPFSCGKNHLVSDVVIAEDLHIKVYLILNLIIVTTNPIPHDLEIPSSTPDEQFEKITSIARSSYAAVWANSNNEIQVFEYSMGTIVITIQMESVFGEKGMSFSNIALNSENPIEIFLDW